MSECYITIPKPIVDERSSFTATSYFRSGDAGSASTTAKYRVDCLTTGTKLEDWTSLSVAESISIPIASNTNRIISNSNRFEKKQITIASDPGETTETRDVITYKVKNIRGFEN